MRARYLWWTMWCQSDGILLDTLTSTTWQSCAFWVLQAVAVAMSSKVAHGTVWSQSTGAVGAFSIAVTIVAAKSQAL